MLGRVLLDYLLQSMWIRKNMRPNARVYTNLPPTLFHVSATIL